MFSKNASGKATSNTVSGAGKHGVLVTDHCGSVALSNNKISNSKQNGICVSNYSNSVSVNSNSISGSGKSGISVSSQQGFAERQRCERFKVCGSVKER